MEQKSRIFQELLAMLKVLKQNEVIGEETAVCIAMMLRDDIKANRWIEEMIESLNSETYPTEKEAILRAAKIAQS